MGGGGTVVLLVELEELVEDWLVELVECEVELWELLVEEKEVDVELRDVELEVELSEVELIEVLEMELEVLDREVLLLVELCEVELVELDVEDIELEVEEVEIDELVEEVDILEVVTDVDVELVLELVDDVEAEVEELLVELIEVDEVDVVVPWIVAGSIAKVLIVQFSRAPIASHCMFWAPAAKADLSDWPPEPTAPVTLDRWFCPAPTVIEVSVVATASINHAPSVTIVVEMEADPPPAPVVPVVPFWASIGVYCDTPLYEEDIPAETEAEFSVIATLFAPVAGASK